MIKQFLVVLCLIFGTMLTARAEIIKIMPIGDSITQGVGNDYPPAKGFDSYRRALFQQLTEAGHEVDFVGGMRQSFRCGEPVNDDFDADHEGHWGWRTDEVIVGRDGGCSGSGNLSAWLEDNLPDMALVHLGTNDAFQARPIEETLKHLESIVDILREANPDMTIFLAKLLPVVEQNTPERGERVAELNKYIFSVAENKDNAQSRVILVDHFTDFDATTETIDGVHPNHLGEVKMASRWFEAIESSLSNR